MKNKFILGLLIGIILGLSTFALVSRFVRPEIRPSVLWIIENPKYADLLKKNYDTYMKTAEDVFYKTIESSGGLK